MTTLIAFLVTLAILIVVHEFGHYAVARLAGVKVLRFSVGFGPVIARRVDRHGTEWALSAVPLGGYVKMLDEREGEVPPEEAHRAFNRQSVWRRSAIVAAGPAANFLLAIALYLGLFAHGLPALKPILGEPPAGTPAQMAGIRAGETVLAINGEPVASWQELHWLSLRHGLHARHLELETRDAKGHLFVRRLDLQGLNQASKEANLTRSLGLVRYLPPLPPVLGELIAGQPAAEAGLQPGDRILRLEGEPVADWEAFVEKIRNAPGQTLDLEIERAGQRLAVSLTPARAEENGRAIGRIGAAPQLEPGLIASLQTEVRYPLPQALERALAKTWELSSFSLEMLGRMIIGEASLKNIAGPITIADYAGQSAQTGLASFIAFLALISISLGVLNLLPVPLLDGGHLLYYSAEILTGRPVPDRVQEIGQRIGIALLGVLMFLALFNDLQRLLT